MQKLPLTCYYPADFILPNKYDLQKAYWLVRKTKDVSDLIIVIGKDTPKELPGKLKEEIWDLMLRSTGGESIRVEVSEKYSPLAYIYKMHEGDTMSSFALALDRGTAEDKDFQETFDAFPNYEIIMLPSPPNDKLSNEMLSAVKEDDFKTFSAGLPAEVSKESKRKLFDEIKAVLPQDKPVNDDEPPVEDASTNEWWNRNLKTLYEKFGLTKV